jgi:hypothetical protein
LKEHSSTIKTSFTSPLNAWISATLSTPVFGVGFGGTTGGEDVGAPDAFRAVISVKLFKAEVVAARATGGDVALFSLGGSWYELLAS